MKTEKDTQFEELNEQTKIVCRSVVNVIKVKQQGILPVTFAYRREQPKVYFPIKCAAQ